MTANDPIAEQSLQWLQSVGEDAETPDKALKRILRGPEPTPPSEHVPDDEHLAPAFLQWIQTHGTGGESPDETIRRLLRGPKPMDGSVDAMLPADSQEQ
jgi:hypothetical protein